MVLLISSQFDCRVSINITKITGHITNLSLVVDMYRDILNVDASLKVAMSSASYPELIPCAFSMMFMHHIS
jgi:hypothetical protein